MEQVAAKQDEVDLRREAQRQISGSHCMHAAQRSSYLVFYCKLQDLPECIDGILASNRISFHVSDTEVTKYKRDHLSDQGGSAGTKAALLRRLTDCP
jgi:hypothetical protein